MEHARRFLNGYSCLSDEDVADFHDVWAPHMLGLIELDNGFCSIFSDSSIGIWYYLENEILSIAFDSPAAFIEHLEDLRAIYPQIVTALRGRTPFPLSK